MLFINLPFTVVTHNLIAFYHTQCRLKMPFTTNSPATYEHDNDGDLSPRPLDEIFAAQPMLPPPLPPLKPLELASIWDSDMIHKFHDENGRPRWRCCHCKGEWYEYNATKALGHVTGIVKDIKACWGNIGSCYKEAYFDLHRHKFNKTNDKRHSINKLNTSLDKTDSNIVTRYASQSMQGGKRSLQDAVDLTEDSPFTNSITTASSARSTVSKKCKATFQTTITNRFTSSTSTARSHPESIRAANVAFAHWCLANSLPFNIGECLLFKRYTRLVQNTGSDYSPPSRYEVGGSLLNATYDSYYEQEVAKLLDDVELYGITVYGDGATIKTTPLINILACSPGNPACVLDVIDCSNHMSDGGKKDAKYIATETLKVIAKIENLAKRSIITIMFDGASNVQKAGEIMRQHCPSATVEHGAEHVVSLVVEKFIMLPCFKEVTKFCKLVSRPGSWTLTFL